MRNLTDIRTNDLATKVVIDHPVGGPILFNSRIKLLAARSGRTARSGAI